MSQPYHSDKQPEPDECGQAWPDVVVTVWLWSGIVFFATTLFLSALVWIGIF